MTRNQEEAQKEALARSQTCCWITWEKHQRSRSLASQLQIPLLEFSRSGGRVKRYLLESVATVKVLLQRKPRLVFAQVPSVVLGHLLLVLAKLLRFRLVLDAHNAVIEGAERGRQPMRLLYRVLLRNADLVIVTNSSLAGRVHSLGGKTGVLPDPVPKFVHDRPAQIDPNSVVVISTWAEDEPIGEVIRAASSLPAKLSVTITGRPKGPHAGPASKANRVRLSGFVSDVDYVEMLAKAAVIVDLTTREDCLVCGAYEALALGRPLVVSDSRALRELLKDGAMYSQNEADAIARAITEVSQREPEWASRSESRREAYLHEWQSAAARLWDQVGSLVSVK